MVVVAEVASVYAMFSGGHDSLAAAIVASKMDGFAGAVHLNTGIGVEQTRQFVRETCAEHDWPLVELHAERGYEQLVLERGGFPYGPQAHNSFYWHLKQKPLRRWVKTIPGETIKLVTGIRREESSRRMLAAMSQSERKEGRWLWLAPILDWSRQQVDELIFRDDFDRNEVVDLLHRSGECLCGALARADEIHDIDTWFPDVGQRIHALERLCEQEGIAASVWASRESRRNQIGDGQGMLFSKAMLCSSCEAEAE